MAEILVPTERTGPPPLSIEKSPPEMAAEIHRCLECPNWAPWLWASASTIANRARIFPDGQLLIRENSLLVAMLSLNRIDWNGDPNRLPHRIQVAGAEPADYRGTYQPDGNTLVLMSMAVAPEAKGKQLPTRMIEHVRRLAGELGARYVISAFRPSGYGSAKKQHGFGLPFWEYCQMTQPGTEKPVDPWLRSLWWNGMKLLKEDTLAMRVSVPLDRFAYYRQTYHPENWQEIEPGVWECGEVGRWTVGTKTAVYQESNVWGIIP